MKSTLIKDTTKEERIALIREWIPDDDGLGDDCEIIGLTRKNLIKSRVRAMLVLFF